MSNEILKTALAGCGYWGAKIHERLYRDSNFDLKAIIEPNTICCKALTGFGNGSEWFTDWESFKRSSLFNSIDLVCLFTPPETHYDLSAEVLRAGKHVILAKPLINSEKEVRGLYSLARREGRALLIDYTFEHHAGIKLLGQLLPMIGQPRLFVSRRANWGKHQKHGVIADLIPHDISIMNHLFGMCDGDFTVTQTSSVCENDDAHVIIDLNDVHHSPITAKLTLSWSCPKKERVLFVNGTKGLLELDFDANQINLISIDDGKPPQVLGTKSFKIPEKDALNEEFHFFGEILLGADFGEIMDYQERVTIATCKIISESLK